MDSGQRSWSILRILRSDPPGQATAGNRLRTFQAALEQAEELWRAGEAVSPSVSPIILFYGLTQAARALCASLDSSPKWDGSAGHGLTILKPDVAAGAKPTLNDVTVRDSGTQFVQQVAAIVGSPTLAGDATLAELIGSLPSICKFLLDPPGPRPITIHESTFDDFTSDSDKLSLLLEPLPEPLQNSVTSHNGSRAMLPLDEADVVKWLSNFPRLAQLGSPRVGIVNPVNFDEPMTFSLEVEWTLEQPLSYIDRRKLVVSLINQNLNDSVGGSASGDVLPAIGGNSEPMHPLIAWWIVLFAFSMLARYHPRTWMALLDVNRSQSAVVIGMILDIAADEVPQLLVDQFISGDDQAGSEAESS